MAAGSTARLRKPLGLGQRKAFLRVQASGQRFRGQFMGLLVASGAGPARIGFTVSRKVGNAVVRNHVRRRFKEVVRLHPQLLVTDHEHVVIAYPAAATASYDVLDQELTCLLGRAQAWASRQALRSR